MTTPAQRWSALHHGIEPTSIPLLRGWLALMWWAAGPLARLRVPPTAVTALGVLLAFGAVLLARPAPAAATVLVVLAAGCDGLDGAVAVLGRRASRLGARADAVADRIADAAFAAVLWRCGAPWWAAVLAAALALGVDTVRRLRHVPTLITVGERPSWTICAALACVCAAVSTSSWPVWVCTGGWLLLGAVAVTQVLRRDGPSTSASRPASGAASVP